MVDMFGASLDASSIICVPCSSVLGNMYTFLLRLESDQLYVCSVALILWVIGKGHQWHRLNDLN